MIQIQILFPHQVSLRNPISGPMLYDKEIQQLEEQLTTLNEQRQEMRDLSNGTLDHSLRNLYLKEEGEIIDAIDEVEQAIEILKNKQEGSKNGYDEHAREIDWTNPDNWPQIRGMFGFGEEDPPSEN